MTVDRLLSVLHNIEKKCWKQSVAGTGYGSPMANGVLLFSSSVIEVGGWVIFVLQVAAMYKNQKNSGQVSGSAPDPEDFYWTPNLYLLYSLQFLYYYNCVGWCILLCVYKITCDE